MVTEWKGGPEVEECGNVGKTVEVEQEKGTDLGAEMGGVGMMGMEAGVREAVGTVLEADGEGSEDLVFLGVVSSGSFAALACFFFLSVAKTLKISSLSSSSSLSEASGSASAISTICALATGSG